MRRIIIGLSLLIAACAAQRGAAAVENACPPEGYDRARLEAFKAGGWAIPEEQERNALARALTACLSAYLRVKAVGTRLGNGSVSVRNAASGIHSSKRKLNFHVTVKTVSGYAK